MKERFQTSTIRVLRDGFNNIGEPADVIPAPRAFDWCKYPERLVIDGQMLVYVGALEANPYYVRWTPGTGF